MSINFNKVTNRAAPEWAWQVIDATMDAFTKDPTNEWEARINASAALSAVVLANEDPDLEELSKSEALAIDDDRPAPAEASEAQAQGGLRSYLVGVCELDGAGNITGTHHVSSHVAESVEDAAKAGINETACDWGCDDESSLHVLFVMAAQVAGLGALPEIDVLEYDERA